jgi:C4-dicarboxylate-specific signal transduction histidine kinase
MTPTGQTPTHPKTSATTIEEQIEKLEERFEQLKIEVRQAQQLSAMGPAAATIAHEYNNLLAPVLAWSQAALDSDDPELTKKALRITAKHAKVLKAMSERVMEVAAAKRAEYQAVPVRQAVEDALESLCRDLKKDGIRFNNEVPDDTTAWTDPLYLHQVFFNLLLNARDAMAPQRSGRLTVRAANEGDKTRIEVSDNGPGIEPDLLCDIFDPFKSSKPSMRNGRQRCGGLGLALCKDLIEDSNGTISVTSEPEEGTTFTIILPANGPRQS